MIFKWANNNFKFISNNVLWKKNSFHSVHFCILKTLIETLFMLIGWKGCLFCFKSLLPSLKQQKKTGYCCQNPENPLSQSSAYASTLEKSLMIDGHLTATYIQGNICDGIRWQHFTQFQHGVGSRKIFFWTLAICFKWVDSLRIWR